MKIHDEVLQSVKRSKSKKKKKDEEMDYDMEDEDDALAMTSDDLEVELQLISQKLDSIEPDESNEDTMRKLMKERNGIQKSLRKLRLKHELANVDNGLMGGLF